jgi:hypothetical protein
MPHKAGRLTGLHIRLVEPEPPKVDRAVLDFVKGHVFDSVGFCHSRWRRLPAQSGNGADGRGKVAEIENLRRRPAGIDVERS